MFSPPATHYAHSIFAERHLYGLFTPLVTRFARSVLAAQHLYGLSTLGRNDVLFVMQGQGRFP